MTQTAFGAAEEWNFFALSADGALAACETWTDRMEGKGRKASRGNESNFESNDESDDLRDEDAGMLFRYYWVPLNPGLEIAGRQHDGWQFLNLSANPRESTRIERVSED